MEPKYAGGNLTKFPLTYSLDGKILFCCCSTLVKLINVKTLEHVRVLKGHTATVVGVCANPLNRLQVFSASKDGTVRVWDVSDGTCLDVIEMGAPVEHFVVSGDTIIANVDPKPNKHYEDQPRSCRIISYHLPSRTLTKLYKSKACRGIAVQGDIIASIGTNSLSIYRRSSKKLIRLTHSHSLTTIVFHPSDSYLATGDDEGRIVLWHGYDTPNVVTSHLHWHAHSVSALAFTDDGSYLLSGGEEAVLVLWQLDTGNKQFIPRLGSTLRNITISPNGNVFTLGGADNCIRFMSAVSSKVEKIIQGLAHANTHALRRGQRGLRTGLVKHPNKPWVVLQGMPGHLQFYDVLTDKHMGEVCITSRNLVSRTHKQLPNTNRVDVVAFDQAGDWMASVDRWVETGRSDQVCLKVWARSPHNVPPYVNHTRVDQPHKNKISCICFHPSRPLFVTASVDGSFKLWEPQVRTSSQRTLLNTPAWAVRSEGLYRKGCPIYKAAFSSDGSLLALGYGQVITLWDPDTLALRRTLCPPSTTSTTRSDHKDNIRWIWFAPDTQFLVAASSRAIYAWDLLTASVRWSYTLPLAGFATCGVSSNSPLFVVASPADKKESKTPAEKDSEADVLFTVLLFDARSHVPVKQWRVTDLKPEVGKDLRLDAALCLVETKEQGTQLIYRNKFKQLVALNVEEAQGNSKDLPFKAAAVETEDNPSLFEQLYKSEPVKAQKRKSTASTSQPVITHGATAMSTAHGRIRNPEVFEAPSHVLPVMSVMYTAFIDLVLRKRPASQLATKRARIEDTDSKLENSQLDEDTEEVQSSSTNADNVDLDAKLLKWDTRYLNMFASQA